MSDNVVLEDGTVRPRAEAEALGAPQADPTAVAAENVGERRRAMFDTAGHKAFTFAEGVVDALSMGLIRETGEEADIRRDVNSGWAMAGEVLGFAGGMAGGPVRAVTHGAEAAGRAAAKTMLRAGEKSIISRAAQEAAAGAALSGGQAFGHAVMDSIVEDKEFASEAILHEAKLGGLIGGIGGVLLGGLGKVARRDVKAQGGFVGDIEEAIKPHQEALSAYDAVVQRHAAEVGVLRELRAAGDVPAEFLEPRVTALRNAARTRDVLDRIDARKALSGDNDVLYRRFQKASVQHRAAVRELDAIMQVAPPDPHAGLSALNDIVDTLPPIKDAEAVASFDLAPTETPAVSTAADPELDAMMAKRDRMRANMQATAGERAKFRDMANGGNLLEPRVAPRAEPAPAPAPEPAPSAGSPEPAPVAETTVPDIEPVVPEVALSKPRPIDAADARVQQAMNDLVAKTGGRLDAAGSLAILEHAGIRPSGDNVGAYIDQVYALRKAGVLAADEARGVKTGLRSALEGAMAGAVGHAVGGPMGAVAAVAADLMYLKRGGKLAAASGRLMGQAAQAAEKLLTSKRVRVLAGAGATIGANKPWAYSEKGPIKDPVERIQEVQFLAANPDTIRQRVADSAADLADQPQLLRALQDRTVNQVQRVALRAPAILFDKLGRALMPPAGKMREFHEYENAVHDLPGLLEAIGRGVATKPQVQALQENWPSVHGKVALGLLVSPDELQKLSRETLRMIETVTGASLSNASDPMWLARQAAAWVPPAPPQQPQAPQAFNINPEGAPTPSQANASGRAPGNN